MSGAPRRRSRRSGAERMLNASVASIPASRTPPTPEGPRDVSVATPGDGMLHPLALFSVFVLALNDHWGKSHLPPLLAGKLSDFTGLALFPLLLESLWELATRRLASRAARNVCVALTAAVFALVKTTHAGNAAYASTVGALQWPFYAALSLARHEGLPARQRVSCVMDPTDLVALVALLAPLWVSARRAGLR